MKKLLFLLLPVMMFSCGSGVEKYRAEIETLSNDWDSTSAAVSDFTQTLNGDLSNFTQLASQMRLSDDVQKSLTPEQTAQWQAAQTGFTQALQAFAPIRTQVVEFSKAWSEKSAEVQALKDGLNAGKLEGDVNAKIAELRALIVQANESLASWKTAHAAAKNSTQTAADAMKMTYDSLSAAPVMKK